MIRIMGRGGGTAEPRAYDYSQEPTRDPSQATAPLAQDHSTSSSFQQEYRAAPHDPYASYSYTGTPTSQRQYPYQPDHFEAMSIEDDRKTRRWYLRIPFLTIAVIIACIVVFIVTMAINNCPAQPHLQGQYCLLPWLGRFSFEPWNVNPMLGPSAKTLLDMGALYSVYVMDLHQTWRLLTAMWLHAGVIHIISNMLGIYFLGAPMEKEFGIFRVGFIYFLAGISGAILSSLLLGNQVSVGASGALFGLAGATMSELLINWDLYANKVAAFVSILVLILINLAIGLLPYIDNFAHIGGCCAGILLGLVLLVKPQRGYVDLRSRDNVVAAASAAEAGVVVVSARNSMCQNITRILAAVAFLALFFTGLGFVLTGSEANCSWCHYLSCVPTSLWSCDASSAAGVPGGTPVCQKVTYANGTGLIICQDNTSKTFANLTSYSNYQLRGLCTQTCS